MASRTKENDAAGVTKGALLSKTSELGMKNIFSVGHDHDLRIMTMICGSRP